MSPKNIHLFFAQLLCLEVFCTGIDPKPIATEDHFASPKRQYSNGFSSLIKGIPKKIIIENVFGDFDTVNISWLRPMVNGMVSRFKPFSSLWRSFSVWLNHSSDACVGLTCSGKGSGHLFS
ncbi:MAG: hypothetical protein AAF985_01430 [Bacteroidota bacterium]